MKKINTNQVKNACKNIVSKILGSKKEYDFLIGINRGGLIPLGYLSYYLNNKNTKIIDVSLYEEKILDINEDKIIQMGKNVIEVFSSLKKEKEDPKILIIDDLVDTGSTLDLIQIINENFFNFEIDYAVMFKNPDAIFTPDFYGALKDPEVWIEFPWDERIVVNKI